MEDAITVDAPRDSQPAPRMRQAEYRISLKLTISKESNHYADEVYVNQSYDIVGQDPLAVLPKRVTFEIDMLADQNREFPSMVEDKTEEDDE